MAFVWIDAIGEMTLKKIKYLFDMLFFMREILSHLFSLSSYNSAMKMVTIKQIYFTTVEIIPLFITTALIFGSVIIGVVIAFATQYGLHEHIGSILITFVMNEFAPFFTALLIALRSGSAINSEIAVMKVNKELNTLTKYGINIVDYLFLPRMISGMLSVTLLSLMFTIIMIGSGYLFMLFYMDMQLISYKILLVNAVGLEDIFIQIGKSILFGFIVVGISIHSAIRIEESYTAIPISVSKGMVRLFLTLFFIEVLSLQLQLL